MKTLCLAVIISFACHAAFAAGPVQPATGSKVIMNGPRTVMGTGIIGGPAKNNGMIRGQPIMRRHNPS
jgi:hypothetical protein